MNRNRCMSGPRMAITADPAVLQSEGVKCRTVLVRSVSQRGCGRFVPCTRRATWFNLSHSGAKYEIAVASHYSGPIGRKMELNALSTAYTRIVSGMELSALLAAQVIRAPSNFRGFIPPIARTRSALNQRRSRISLVTHLASICMRYSPIGCRDCNGNCASMECAAIADWLRRHGGSTWHMVFASGYYLT